MGQLGQLWDLWLGRWKRVTRHVGQHWRGRGKRVKKISFRMGRRLSRVIRKVGKMWIVLMWSR